jgi:hypothetical protein
MASRGFYTLWRPLFLVGIQELLRHKDVETKMVYAQVLNEVQLAEYKRVKTLLISGSKCMLCEQKGKISVLCGSL